MKNHQQKDQLCRKQKHQQIPFSDKVLILSNAFAVLRTFKKNKANISFTKNKIIMKFLSHYKRST